MYSQSCNNYEIIIYNLLQLVEISYILLLGKFKRRCLKMHMPNQVKKEINFIQTILDDETILDGNKLSIIEEIIDRLMA